MADDALSLKITAQTDDFVKKVDDAKTKVRSLSMQMAEIDKQLKTESVDRVAKLSEKLELAKRAAEMAAKEAELYGEKVKKLTEKHEDASKLTDKQKESLLKLSEQMATAQQKANTYAAEVDKLQREYDEITDTAKLTEKATENLGDAFSDASNSAEDLSDKTEKSSNKISAFFERFKQISLTDIGKKALSNIAGFFADIASKAWEAAKAIVSFAKDYAKNAVEMAASYEDALGYSEQVFGNYATQVQKWVEENSLSLRVGESNLIQYVNKFGALFTAFGYGAEEAAKKSQSMVQLAVDLRAATGDDLSQVIQTLTSGLTGGYKAFQRYGVVVNEARLQATALANDLVTVDVNQLEVEKATIKVTEANKKAAEALQKYGEDSIEYQKAQIGVTEAENALTTALGGKELALTQVQKQEALAIILGQDLATVDGQAARESESYSSQLALKDTLLENLQKRIGEKLLPVFTEFITKVNDFMQSDAGKAVMDALTEAVGLLADKVMELLQDERLTEWISKLQEEVPKVTEKFLEFTGKIGDLIPKVLDLTEKVVDFFYKSQQTKDVKQAYAECQQELHKFADAANVDYNDLIKVIKLYSEETDTNLADIYNKWGEYQPLIVQYMDEISTEADGTKTDVHTALSGMGSDVQGAINDMANTDTSGLDGLRERVRGWADSIATAVSNALDWLRRGEEANSFIDENGNERRYGGGGWIGDGSWKARSSGGPVQAGRMYRVNDDAGRRIETFVPNMDGYILNGNDTQRVINNSTNNSRTYGDLNVYVNSYGTDAASIADEIGTELNRKLRMAGSW